MISSWLNHSKMLLLQQRQQHLRPQLQRWGRQLVRLMRLLLLLALPQRLRAFQRD
jgi:hypothetical protein